MTKVVAIVQARMGSRRLPGKVLADIAGKPSIGWTLSRVRGASSLDEAWLATSEDASDNALAAYACTLNVPVFRGDVEDVLGRYAQAARVANADVVVRITGDCPLIDPGVIDQAVAAHRHSGADYATNAIERTFPDGLDVEVMTRTALDRADAEAKHPFLREHVTPYIHGLYRDRLPAGIFSLVNVKYEADFSHLRWTLDEPDDLDFLRRLWPLLPKDFNWLDVIAILTHRPELLKINHRIGLNEGAEGGLAKLARGRNSRRSYGESDAYFERASRTIPLASQTFSKSYQQWVRGAAPLFIKSARGCRVSDIDDNSYIDYVLSLLPIVLGYGDTDVDQAIRAQLDDGIVFSLASPLEAQLAEQLVRIIPCAEMVRFGKNGSDATTGAIRLARAYTGRDKVAICGYHGWHDWYIGTTTRDLGVPKAVKALSQTFAYNDASALRRMLESDRDGYAAIVLEPAGAQTPAPQFLETLRELATHYGVVLIFDEIVTGFRINLGGAQAYYGVIPDLACFGKAMANGMPISALVGRADIMKSMEDIFFSSTFGGEALSLAASLATLKKLEDEKVPDRIWKRGDALRNATNGIFARHGLADVVKIYGDGWWPKLAITKPPVEDRLMMSLLRQEFAAAGLLLAGTFNLSLAHDSDAVMNETLAALDLAMAEVRGHLDSPDPAARLRGRPIQPTFSVR